MNGIEDHIIESINKMEELIMSFANQKSHFPKDNEPIREWMTLAEAAKYAGVSNNTFSKFRLLGLKVSHVEGIKRVSRKEIDNFLEKNSF
ncbi:helix-turn-helix domain-containing protein [Psychrobacillus sp. FSL K6-4046]|uniref:helix-turn-helix domain-containing protein n=1 Tax=Psychrobacillus sp. FSL K6-4046 TaxID=2921550 RepID=UPI00315A765A